MNLCFKADPSIALLVDSEGWNQQKGVLQIRFTVIDSFSNISTRGNLDSAQTSPTLFMTSKRRSRSDLELLVDYITGQYGNSVKALVKFFVRVPCLYEIKFHRRCATWSETKRGPQELFIGSFIETHICPRPQTGQGYMDGAGAR